MFGFNLVYWNNCFALGSVNIFSSRVRTELGSVTKTKWLWASCMKSIACLVILTSVECTWAHTEQCHHISFMGLFLDTILFRVSSILHRNLRAPTSTHSVISRPPGISFLSLFFGTIHTYVEISLCLHLYGYLVILRVSQRTSSKMIQCCWQTL